ERRIDFANFAGNGRVNIVYGLDRFDGAEGLPGFELNAGPGQLDVNDGAKFMLGVVGDADSGDSTFHAYPLMFFRITIIARIHLFSRCAGNLPLVSEKGS